MNSPIQVSAWRLPRHLRGADNLQTLTETDEADETPVSLRAFFGPGFFVVSPNYTNRHIHRNHD